MNEGEASRKIHELPRAANRPVALFFPKLRMFFLYLPNRKKWQLWYDLSSDFAVGCLSLSEAQSQVKMLRGHPAEYAPWHC